MTRKKEVKKQTKQRKTLSSGKAAVLRSDEFGYFLLLFHVKADARVMRNRCASRPIFILKDFIFLEISFFRVFIYYSTCQTASFLFRLDMLSFV